MEKTADDRKENNSYACGLFNCIFQGSSILEIILLLFFVQIYQHIPKRWIPFH